LVRDLALIFALSRFVRGEKILQPLKDVPLRIPMRRYPSGVDRRFDSIASDTDEFVRLARRGHVFSAGEGQAFTDNINRAPMLGPIDMQQEQP
jgi:hypothetical protein